MLPEPFSGTKTQQLVAATRHLPHGALLTFDEIEAIIGCNPKTSRATIYNAAKTLERSAHRTLMSVRNIGYRIALPGEHEALAVAHHRKARRQVTRAINKLGAADRTQLDATQLSAVDAHRLLYARHEAILRIHDMRLAELERSRPEVEQRLSALEQALEARKPLAPSPPQAS